jgi:ABC-type lipoprotein release transport system permease subunit
VIVVVALAVLVFTATVSVLSSLQSAPESFGVTDQLVLMSPSAPTIFSSQVDESLAGYLESSWHANTSAEILAFTAWNGTGFVVRGVNLEDINRTGPAFDLFDVVQAFSASDRSSAVIGSRLLERLSIEVPATIPLVGSYSSRVQFVTVVGSFSSGSSLDDELLVSLDAARFLSGMPMGKVSLIRVESIQTVEQARDVFSPDRARFAIYDLRISKGTVASGEQFEVSLGVKNWGGAAGAITVGINTDEGDHNPTNVSLSPGLTTVLITNMSIGTLGAHTVEAVIGGDFPVTLTTSMHVVPPYLQLSAPQEVVLGSTFDVRVSNYLGEYIGGAEVLFSGQVAFTDSNGKVTLTADQAGTHDIVANHSMYLEASQSIDVIDLSTYPDDFLPTVLDFFVDPNAVRESESAMGTVILVNQGRQAGTYNLTVNLDGSPWFFEPGISLGPAETKIVSFAIPDLAVGSHVFSVGSFAVDLTVEPWYSGDSDLIQLVIRYGGVLQVTTGSSLPMYQAAKISEGNITVAVIALAVISMLLSTLAVSSVFSKELHEARRRLGVMKTVGASSRQIRKMVVGQSFETSLPGAAIGVALGIAVSDLVSRAGVFFLFGHRFEIELNTEGMLLILLGATAIRKLEEEGPPPLDVDQLLGDE